MELTIGDVMIRDDAWRRSECGCGGVVVVANLEL